VDNLIARVSKLYYSNVQLWIKKIQTYTEKLKRSGSVTEKQIDIKLFLRNPR
jgi:hypothetical protein